MIDTDYKGIPITRQRALLRISRSSVYYRPRRDALTIAFEQRLLNTIDALYTEGTEQYAGRGLLRWNAGTGVDVGASIADVQHRAG